MAVLVFVLMTAMAVVSCERRDPALIPLPSLNNIPSVVLNNDSNKVPVDGSNIRIFEFGETTTTTTDTSKNTEGGTSPTEAPENTKLPKAMGESTSVHPDRLPQATETPETTENTNTTELPETIQTTTTELPETIQTTTTEMPETIQTTTTEMPETVQTNATEMPETIQTTATEMPETVQTTTTEMPETIQTTATEMPETVQTTTEMPETTKEEIPGSGSGSGDDEDGSGELGSGEEDNGACPRGFILSSDLHRCYLLSTVRADWFEAKERCWMRNSYLVKIETREENDFLLRAVAKRKDDFLIGGNDIDTQFKFVWDQDKRTFVFTQWGPDEPNNQFGRERCVELKYYYKQDRWYWNDLPCSLPKYFICEIPSWF